jgi:hypothetical protein
MQAQIPLTLAKEYTLSPQLHANLPQLATQILTHVVNGTLDVEWLEFTKNGLLKAICVEEGMFELPADRVPPAMRARALGGSVKLSAIEYWIVRVLMTATPQLQPLRLSGQSTIGQTPLGTLGQIPLAPSSLALGQPTLGSFGQSTLGSLGQSNLMEAQFSTPQSMHGQFGSSTTLQPTSPSTSQSLFSLTSQFLGSTTQQKPIQQPNVQGYAQIIQSILDYIFPTIQHPPSLAATGRYRSTFLRNQSKALLPERTSVPAALGEFLVDAVLQLWCYQTLGDLSLPTTLMLGSVDVVLCHLVKLDEESFGRRAHGLIVPRVYPMVKAAFRGSVDLVKLAVILWIHVMEPWKLNGVEYDESFRTYVVQNYAWYSSLLKVFLDRVKDSVVEYSSELEKVLEFFVKTRLVHTVADLEIHLLNHDALDPTSQAQGLQEELLNLPIWNVDLVPASRQDASRILRVLRGNVEASIKRSDLYSLKPCLEKILIILDDLFPQKTTLMPVAIRPEAPPSQNGEKQWMSPNVLLPECLPDGNLTPRGKFQVKHGLAKMGASGVSVRGDVRRVGVRDDEVPILVNLLSIVAVGIEWIVSFP